MLATRSFAHMMPGLPSSSPSRDIDDFYKQPHDPAFKPDMLKIYPTLVLKNTGLYSIWKRGNTMLIPMMTI